MSERRGSTRIATTFPIRVTGPQGSVAAVGRDLSREGFFVELSRLLPIGQRIECRLTLGEDVVEVVAEVRRHAKDYLTTNGGGPFKGVGARIVRLDADALATIETYLAGRVR